MSPRHIKILIAVLAALAVGALATWGFVAGRGEAAREAQTEQQIKAPQRVSSENGEPMITLDAAAQRKDGIETIRLTNTLHPQELRAYGTVLDLQSLTDLSNSYANAKAQVQIAQAKLSASRMAFERARELYQDQQNMSAAQLQANEAAFRTDQATLASAQSQLRTLAVTAQQTWGTVLGQALTNSMPLLGRLVTRQDVLLQVTLRPEQAIAQPPTPAWVQLDDSARVRLQFVSAATKTDPRIQGASYLFSAPATTGLLSGMNVVTRVPATRAVEAAVVPLGATVWAQGEAWAYFRTGATTFARRSVPTDLAAPEGGYVVQGQPDNTEVVVQGAQMLFSEEFRAQAQVSD